MIQVHPEFLRMPRSGQACPYSGLSRTALDLLTRPQDANDFRPPVESRVLLQRGQKKGIRLVSYSSLMDYLHRLPVEARLEGAK